MQAVADAHVLQNGGSIKAQQAQQLQQYAQQQITQPTEAYLHETLQQHLQGLKPNLSEVLLCMLQPLSGCSRALLVQDKSGRFLHESLRCICRARTLKTFETLTSHQHTLSECSDIIILLCRLAEGKLHCHAAAETEAQS